MDVVTVHAAKRRSMNFSCGALIVMSYGALDAGKRHHKSNIDHGSFGKSNPNGSKDN